MHRVAELVVAQDAGAGIVALELTQEVEEGTTLGVGAGVGRMAVFVQTALVADADTLVVPVGGMGAYLVATGGATMDDQVTDLPVVLIETTWGHENLG